jgi:hypothetical protein
VTFDVLTVTRMKVAVSLRVALCSLVDIVKPFTGTFGIYQTHCAIR